MTTNHIKTLSGLTTGKPTDDLINRVVEFCLTRTETFSVNQSQGAVKINPDDHFWMRLVPDRTAAGDLLPASAEHRRKRIAIWQAFARKELNA